MARFFVALMSLWMSAGHAEEVVMVCYNYGCLAKAEVRISDTQLEEVHGLLNGTSGAEAERAAVAEAVGLMYRMAGQQTPIWRDKAGNLADDLVDGRMDCIDHSTNTHSWLNLFSRQGWLRFHEVLPPVKRGVIFTHWAGRMGEVASRQQYVVDSWFYDHGHPAVVFTLEEWLAGARANGTFW